MAIKHGLGRGLGALIGEVTGAAPAAAAAPRRRRRRRVKAPLNTIAPSPWQPRRSFAPNTLPDLVNSLRERGMLPPLLVAEDRTATRWYAGEQRFRAAKEAGLTEIPVIVMDVADHESLEVALVREPAAGRTWTSSRRRSRALAEVLAHAGGDRRTGREGPAPR